MLNQESNPDTIETANVLWNAVTNGASLKELNGISDHTMENIYAYAYEFYQKGRLDEAEVFFRFLSLYDICNADYIFGLAAVFQQQQRYQSAADAYAVAFALFKNDYRPMFYAGQCYLLLKRKNQARRCFVAVTKSSSAPEALKIHAQTYVDSITPTKEARENND